MDINFNYYKFVKDIGAHHITLNKKNTTKPVKRYLSRLVARSYNKTYLKSVIVHLVQAGKELKKQVFDMCILLANLV